MPPLAAVRRPPQLTAVAPRVDVRPVGATSTRPAVRGRAPADRGAGPAQPPIGNGLLAASLQSVPRNGLLPGRTVPPPAVAAPPVAGNAAVAAALTTVPQAQAAPTGKAAPTEQAATTEQADGQAGAARPTAERHPKFAALKREVRAKGKAVAASHPPARTEAGAAQAAARPPADDKVAQGKAANAEKMDAAEAKPFDKAAFIRAVEDAIAKQAPKNLDEADKFGDSDRPEQVKRDVQGQVAGGKRESADEIATTTAAPPDTSKAVPKEVVPLAADRPPPVPGAPDARQAVPDKLPPAATDLSAGPQQVERDLAGAQVTEPQLARSNEPAFTGALKHKHTAEQDAARATPAMRKHEAGTLAAATTDARARGAGGMSAIAGDRTATGRKVGAGKTGAKGRDETKRAEVTAALQRVFDATKKDVEDILSGLDKKVEDQFGREERQARDAFTAEHKRKMGDYKSRRYSGPLGPFRWGRDLFLGLPEEANQIFTTARDHYVERMRTVISNVADTVAAELNRAKARIAKGRTDLRAAVAALPADLRAIGQEAAEEFTGRFDELSQSVDDKGSDLVQTLATKYNEALKSVDEEIAREKERNKGLVAKAVDAVKGVIRTIMELKNLLLGVLRKAASAVLLILKDPIGFLRNLVSGVGAGLRQFLRNIVKHLGQGLVTWLLGTAARVGLRLPAKLDVKGILLLIASLLGLNWPGIRARLARKGVPAPALAAAETAVPLVAKVRREGVGGMWDEVRGRVGDLRRTLISKVSDYLIPTVIVAGVTWVLSLFNPASAFIRACKLIIDIVRFVVENARQILEFVNAVLDAVIAIAKGGAGGVPGLVERALARAVPLLIGFLAALLGIGGIAGKVRQIFDAMSRPVQRAIDWVIDKLADLAKKLWARLKGALDRRRRRKPDRTRRPARHRRPDPARARRRPARPAKRPARREDDSARRRILMAALREAGQLAKRSGDEGEVREGLPAIRARHRLSALTFTTRDQGGARVLFEFAGVINPRATFDQLAVNKFLADAQAAFKRHGAFSIEDAVGPGGIIVPGLTTTLGLGATQARKYATLWVNDGKLTVSYTSRKRAVYSFVPKPTDADLLRPEDHPEYPKWIGRAPDVPIATDLARELWFLIIEGMRLGRPDNFETVAARLMRGMHVLPRQGALWSGGEDLSDYARSLGYTTLEKQDFYKITQGLDLHEDWIGKARPVWAAFSRRYASQLRDEIHVFMRQFRAGSVLVDIELDQIDKIMTTLRIRIELRWHAMEWGDDPTHVLNSFVPGYWRELGPPPKAEPLRAGAILVQRQGPAAAAVAIAERRFWDKQARKGVR